jgi:hypothetical protein
VALKLNADNPLVRHYDKLIVVAVLIALVISLFYLTSAAGPRRQQEEESYKQQLENLKPASANLAAADMSDYQGAERLTRAPLQLERPDDQQAGFFLPETRVVCVVKECKKLIPYAAETCPFCGAPQPIPGKEDLNLDSDGDGIPDKVEIQLGLNPTDPSDAKGDLDGDGFSNLEEYLAKTDPKNPKDHPALVVLLRVKELRGKKLPLLFIGKNTMPGGKTQLQIKDLSKQQTFYLYEGDKIGNAGYVISALTLKTEKQDRGGNPVNVDVSTVVLKRLSDNKEVTLAINDKNVKVTDVEAVIVLPLDNTEYTVLEGGALKIRDETYRVLSVDSAKTTVTIENEATGQEKVIPKLD